MYDSKKEDQSLNYKRDDEQPNIKKEKENKKY